MREASKEFDEKKISCCAIFFLLIGCRRRKVFCSSDPLARLLEKKLFSGDIELVTSWHEDEECVEGFDLINASCIL